MSLFTREVIPIETEVINSLIISCMSDTLFKIILKESPEFRNKLIALMLGIDINIVKEYTTGEMPLYHMDVYRLEDENENIGLEDYFNGNGVSIIEWSELISDILPDERLDIKFKILDENTRIIKLTPHGQKYEDIVNYVI